MFDGEVAIYDQQFRSRFDWLREPDPGAVATPPVYMMFDVLYRHGRDLSARPLRHRRPELEGLVAGSELLFPVRLAADGLAARVERGYAWSPRTKGRLLDSPPGHPHRGVCDSVKPASRI